MQISGEEMQIEREKVIDVYYILEDNSYVQLFFMAKQPFLVEV